MADMDELTGFDQPLIESLQFTIVGVTRPKGFLFAFRRRPLSAEWDALGDALQGLGELRITAEAATLTYGQGFLDEKARLLENGGTFSSIHEVVGRLANMGLFRPSRFRQATLVGYEMGKRRIGRQQRGDEYA